MTNKQIDRLGGLLTEALNLVKLFREDSRLSRLESKRESKRLQYSDRIKVADQLRAQGKTFTQIASELGCRAGTARTLWITSQCRKRHEQNHPAPEKVLPSHSVDVLRFTVRVSNCLSSCGITTIGDLTARTPSSLLRIRNFGKLCLYEVQKRLAEYGLKLYR